MTALPAVAKNPKKQEQVAYINVLVCEMRLRCANLAEGCSAFPKLRISVA